ncbi:MAG TPA: MFS transporter [Chloroflexota bacterium]|nr:MFS transporter [Chloroflexota bacterium]
MARKNRAIPRPVFLIIGLGAFLAQLDGTMMNVALPTLSRAFHTANLSAVQLVITGYLAASIATLPLLGALADRLGRKRLFLAGFALFGLASIGCAIAGSLPLLIALRVVQATGGALLAGTGLALIAAHGPTRRGHSLGKLALVYALSGLLGPPIGGGLVQAFGWQAVFWVNLPLSLAGFALGTRVLPPDLPRTAKGKLDLTGAVLLAGGAALLTASATAAHQSLQVGGIVLPWPVLGALGLLAFAGLLVREAGAAELGVAPLLDPVLLRIPAFGAGLLLALVSSGVTIGLFVLVPFWLAKGWQVSAGAIGLIFLPVALALGALAPAAGKWSDRIGAPFLTALGMAIGAGAALLLALSATNLIWPLVVIAMLGIGASSGLFAAPNNSAVLGSVPEHSLAMAGSMLSAARTLGVILGVSASGALFDALRAGQGANATARVLFLAAAALYALNATLCWTTRRKHSATAEGAAEAISSAARL